MKRKWIVIVLTVLVMFACCACSNTLENFAGSYYKSDDGWTPDEKATTFTKEYTDENGAACTDSIHIAGNYVSWSHTEAFSDEGQKQAVLDNIEKRNASGETYSDKTMIADEFIGLSDSAGIKNGTVDYTLVIDDESAEHFIMNYEEATSLGN